ncbi:unnamed protein product [Orchesella dallaii]|uniref:Uncharacterized protein n=1 Tax=Orchesella dallaii TaxID=48710 RepID=A0ABP1QNR5_9HEXA
MPLKVSNFLKKSYEDIEMFWCCKMPKGKSQYKVEFIGWITLGYVLGLKRLPANYISLAIIKTFVVLNKTLKPKVHEFQVKVLEQSRPGGKLSVVTYNPDVAPPLLQSQFRNICLFGIWTGSVWAIGKFTKIDVSRQENCALISTTAITSTASILLMTTLSFDSFPNIVGFHRRCCELWILAAVCVLAFIMLFLVQRLQRIFRGEIKPSQTIRMWWESTLFVFCLYMMLLYIPVIHKGFSTRNVIEHKSEILATAVLPTEVSNALKSSSAIGHRVLKSMARTYSRFLRYETSYIQQLS